MTYKYALDDKLDAQVWNQPRATNPKYRVKTERHYIGLGEYECKYQVMQDHGGWALSVSPTYDSIEQAEQFIKEIA